VSSGLIFGQEHLDYAIFPDLETLAQRLARGWTRLEALAAGRLPRKARTPDHRGRAFWPEAGAPGE
jgi:hypothetical protein